MEPPGLDPTPALRGPAWVAAPVRASASPAIKLVGGSTARGRGRTEGNKGAHASVLHTGPRFPASETASAFPGPTWAGMEGRLLHGALLGSPSMSVN